MQMFSTHKHTERTVQPTRHGEEEEAAVADTEALTDPLPADHHPTFSSSSSSPSITPPLLLSPHLPTCLPVSLPPLSSNSAAAVSAVILV